MGTNDLTTRGARTYKAAPLTGRGIALPDGRLLFDIVDIVEKGCEGGGLALPVGTMDLSRIVFLVTLLVLFGCWLWSDLGLGLRVLVERARNVTGSRFWVSCGWLVFRGWLVLRIQGQPESLILAQNERWRHA